jgi:hypothetical protein
MARKTHWSHAAMAVSMLLFVNLLILMAMVIAPSHSRVAELSSAYKLINLSSAMLVLLLAIWRDWFVFLTVFAFLQVIAFFFFANYLNTFPM